MCFLTLEASLEGHTVGLCKGNRDVALGTGLYGSSGMAAVETAFSHVLACVRRVLWAATSFHKSTSDDDQVLLSAHGWDMLLN